MMIAPKPSRSPTISATNTAIHAAMKLVRKSMNTPGRIAGSTTQNQRWAGLAPRFPATMWNSSGMRRISASVAMVRMKYTPMKTMKTAVTLLIPKTTMAVGIHAMGAIGASS